jgi:hypothetical protein
MEQIMSQFNGGLHGGSRHGILMVHSLPLPAFAGIITPTS